MDPRRGVETRPAGGGESTWQQLPQAAGAGGAWAGYGGRVRGWMLDPVHGPFEEIRVFADGSDLGAAKSAPSPGADRHVPWIRGANRAGFAFGPDARLGAAGRIDLIGLRGGAPAGRFGTLVRSAHDWVRPLPPLEIALPSNAAAQLRQAAADEDEASRWRRAFLAGGLAAAASLVAQIDAHRGGPAGLRMLDWGCGCGRVLRHMLDQGFGSVSGCDVDETAISWCESNLAGADFAICTHEPPLPFADASFDVITGCSVFTHLDAADQARWLAELHRVVAPGGLVLVSTQGDFAYRRRAFRGTEVLRRLPALGAIQARWLGRKLAREGIVDRGATKALSGLAPDGYYRSVAQSCEYIRREWSSQFEILDCIERGLDGHQDLVVMQRPQ